MSQAREAPTARDKIASFKMAWISSADYETVCVKCEHCGVECVFNRREDFDDVGPYAGENVVCPSCARVFRMVGDNVNPPDEQFVFAAKEHYLHKRYMLAVASMSQAWELCFAIFVAAHYLYRPFFDGQSEERDIDKLNALQAQLADVLRHHTFRPLRNVVINTVAQGINPKTLNESAEAISRIPRLSNDPSDALIASVRDQKTREVLGQMLALTVGELRNKVLHHRAYRPLRAEAERCLESELDVLYRAKKVLRIGTFEEFGAGVMST